MINEPYTITRNGKKLETKIWLTDTPVTDATIDLGGLLEEDVKASYFSASPSQDVQLIVGDILDRVFDNKKYRVTNVNTHTSDLTIQQGTMTEIS